MQAFLYHVVAGDGPGDDPGKHGWFSTRGSRSCQPPGVADVKEDLNDYDYEHGPYEIRGE